MNGCWDFFSYTGPLFGKLRIFARISGGTEYHYFTATKEGTQIKVVKRIVDRILGKR